MEITIRQKIFALGDHFTISDDAGNPLMKVQGKVISFGDKLKVYDMEDKELYRIEQKVFKLLPEYRIYENDEQVVHIKKQFTFFKPKLNIESKYGKFEVDGDFLHYNFRVLKDRKEVASITKQFISFSDTYHLSVDNNEDIRFLVTLVIVIDQILHDDK